ncbi:MAG: NPCBM/NEW2 domain-containing protein [Pirellulales bacterium]|nr:NPCBM/NEW2 domain-containing protein [Pirellulales bacterium]
MVNSVLAILILAAAVPVEVRLVDGARVEGRLTAIDEQQATFDTPAGPRTMAIEQLMSIESKAPAARDAEAPRLAIRLVDGSEFGAGQFTVSGGQAVVKGSPVKDRIPVERIQSVRLAEAGEAALDQWNRLLGETFHTDVLVVDREGSLNYHGGILRDVSETAIGFEPDGEVLQVKRTKVFGLIYYHPAGRASAGAVATLTDAAGSRWSVRSMSLAGDVLKATTPSGVAIECALADLRRLDFSGGKVVSLGQLKPRSIRWTPYLGTAEGLASQKAFFAPVFDPGADGPPIVLGGKRFARGIALWSRTELDYDLPEGCRRLEAVVGIDDDVRPQGAARLVIRADGRVLLETELCGTEPPQPINLDVSGAARLTILVDFGKGMDLGDHVDLGDARLIK